MNFAAVLGFALVIGTIVILGVAIVSYVATLVRNAYELKVEMRRELDEGLKDIEGEVSRAVKWARGELAGEIDKSRALMAEDLERRQRDIEARVAAEIDAREAAWTAERDALRVELALLEDRLARVEHRVLAKPRPVDTAPAAAPQPTEAVATATVTPLALRTF